MVVGITTSSLIFNAFGRYLNHFLMMIRVLFSSLSLLVRDNRCLDFQNSNRSLVSFGQIISSVITISIKVLLLIGIQKVSTYENADNGSRLPSAATCMNLLKLPQYDNIETLKEKLLLYAIKSNSDFELS